MLDCRYYDLCCFTDDSCNGEPECPKRDHCQFYSPMPDVKALAGLADELSGDTLTVPAVYGTYMGGYVAACQDVARRIRDALGVCRED